MLWRSGSGLGALRAGGTRVRKAAYTPGHTSPAAANRAGGACLLFEGSAALGLLRQRRAAPAAQPAVHAGPEQALQRGGLGELALRQVGGGWPGAGEAGQEGDIVRAGTPRHKGEPLLAHQQRMPARASTFDDSQVCFGVLPAPKHTPWHLPAASSLAPAHHQRPGPPCPPALTRLGSVHVWLALAPLLIRVLARLVLLLEVGVALARLQQQVQQVLLHTSGVGRGRRKGAAHSAVSKPKTASEPPQCMAAQRLGSNNS